MSASNATIPEQIRAAIEHALPGARVEVQPGTPGHYALTVTSAAFVDKTMVESHRLVLSAIAPLMAGDAAPVHAIDSLKTRKP